MRYSASVVKKLASEYTPNASWIRRIVPMALLVRNVLQERLFPCSRKILLQFNNLVIADNDKVLREVT